MYISSATGTQDDTSAIAVAPPLWCTATGTTATTDAVLCCADCPAAALYYSGLTR